MEIVVIALENERELAEQMFPGTYVLVTGVGALNVMKALQCVDRDTRIINIGYAGSNKLPVGTKVSISGCRLYHPSVDYKEDEFYNMSDCGVMCYTSCDFVTQDVSDLPPCVFDMELAFILGMGFENVISIKVVSDNLSVKEYEENVND